jgi:hypothetical protein
MSIFEKAKNFVSSAAAFVAAGLPCVDESEVARRLRICAECEMFDAAGYGGMGKCKECGCNMEIKTVMATEECPKKLW